MKRTVNMIALVLVLTLISGCAKYIRSEYYTESAIVTGTEYHPPYNTVETDGKNVHVRHHSASYTVEVIWNGEKRYFHTETEYELCKNRIGEPVFVVVERRIYDTDESKFCLRYVFDTREKAEKCVKELKNGVA